MCSSYSLYFCTLQQIDQRMLLSQDVLVFYVFTCNQSNFFVFLVGAVLFLVGVVRGFTLILVESTEEESVLNIDELQVLLEARQKILISQ